jgi:murein DD-endopeptidase MepM/ murein hydrolase activator NlpD
MPAVAVERAAPARWHTLPELKNAAVGADSADGMARRALNLALPLAAIALMASGLAHAMGSPRVAALQVGLVRQGLYQGPVDGLEGPATTQAAAALRKNPPLRASALTGRKARAALGAWGNHELGARTLRVGDSGWDVAELQFLLAWHGFPSALFTGVFESHVQAALIRYQRWAGAQTDGIAGRRTILSLKSTSLPDCPIRLAWPLRAPLSSPFGPRGFGFHSGIDIAGPQGAPVAAAAPGRVVWAGFMAGGWGKLVIVAHRLGVRSMYAHLSRIDVEVGDYVQTGHQVGRVGATGDAAGPHLHFEVRVHGAAVDPLPALT